MVSGQSACRPRWLRSRTAATLARRHQRQDATPEHRTTPRRSRACASIVPPPHPALSDGIPRDTTAYATHLRARGLLPPARSGRTDRYTHAPRSRIHIALRSPRHGPTQYRLATLSRSVHCHNRLAPAPLSPVALRHSLTGGRRPPRTSMMTPPALLTYARPLHRIPRRIDTHSHSRPAARSTRRPSAIRPCPRRCARRPTTCPAGEPRNATLRH
jgi:hypothetical protein